MIKLRQYKHGDEKQFEPVEETMRWHPDYQKAWDATIKRKLTWTGLSDGQIVGVGGYIPLPDNSAYIWLQIGANKKKTDVLRLLKKAFEIVDKFNFAFWYTSIKEDFEKGCRLAEYFGFGKTNVLRNGYRLYVMQRRFDG